MGVLDAQVHIGRETTYGTAVAPTRSIEAQSDIAKLEQQFLESVGMRAGMQTLRSDRRRVIKRGASGDIELDFLTKGMGMLLRAATGTSSVTQQGGTAAYLQDHRTTSTGPTGESLTVQIGRPPVTGSVQPFTYHGGKVAEWEFNQALDEYLKFRLTMDYEDEDTATSLAAAAYPSSAVPFHWAECAVTVGGTSTDLREFSVSGNNALKRDRHYLRGSALKKEPVRTEVPTYEGSLSADFEDLTLYTNFLNGTIVPIVATWTGSLIASTYYFKLIITLAACQFNGETPEVSLDDLPSIALPYRVLDNGTDPAVKIEYTSTDTAY